MEWTSGYSPSKAEEKQEARSLCIDFIFGLALLENTRLQLAGIFLESFLNVIGCPPAEWLNCDANAVVPLVAMHVYNE
jgi:hypothetical protein